MIDQIAGHISSFFIKKKIIAEDQKEIYDYSFEILISTLMNLLCLIIISLIFDKVLVTLLFIVGFIPLRSVAGGYHAKTHLRCSLILIATYLMFLKTITLIPSSKVLLSVLCCSLVSTILIFMLAPVQDKNNPLSDKEIEILKAKSRTMIVIYTALVTIMYLIFSEKVYSLSLAMGCLLVSLSLSASVIRNKIISRH